MDKKEESLVIVRNLADLLGVNLSDGRVAVSTDKEEAKVMKYDGSIEAKINSSYVRPTVRVESPRAPGITIELVDHTRDMAPENAIYAIRCFNPQNDTQLNGDIHTIYVGCNGLILDRAGREKSSRII